MNDYQKINTLFHRETNGVIMPEHLTLPEYEYLKDLKWECTEKIDGCLEVNTRIVMADGSTKRIGDINVGDAVIGYDVEGGSGYKIVEVEGVQKKSRAGTWVIIKTTRNGIGKGNSIGRINCTFDHKIYTKNRGYVEAYDLKSDDVLLNIRNDLSLTPIQEQILIGKMLGDGTLNTRENSGFNSANVEWGQKEKEYAEWGHDALGSIKSPYVSERTSGYGSAIHVRRTKNSVAIYEKFSGWINSGHKEVPDNITLTPISLAFWYMDDGALMHSDNQEDRVRFSTNGFNLQSCKNLLRELKKFNIEGDIRDYKGNTICLNAENAEKMFLLIAPYICECKKYKLPERYRDFTSFLPNDVKNEFHKTIVEQKVISVEEDKKIHERWDIQTPTHNFFTAGGLVHNTNTHCEVFYDGENPMSITFHGRTDKAIIPSHLLAKLETIFTEDILSKVFEGGLEEASIEEPFRASIYGEGYGVKIQKGGNYMSNDCGFILFDVKIGKWWLNRGSLEEIADDLNVPIVPLIGYMTIPEAIEFVDKGFKSTIAENKDYDAEGLVLKTPCGLMDRRGERIITKIKTCDFRKYRKVYGKD